MDLVRKNEAGKPKDFDACAGFLVSRSDYLILTLLKKDENRWIEIVNKLVMLLDEKGTEYLKSDEAVKKRDRKKADDKKQWRKQKPGKSYKNANELLKDKLTAFIHVLLCEWKYKSIDDQPLEYLTEEKMKQIKKADEKAIKETPEASEKFAVRYLYAVAMDSIYRIKEKEEFYNLKKVLESRLEKTDPNSKTL